MAPNHDLAAHQDRAEDAAHENAVAMRLAHLEAALARKDAEIARLREMLRYTRAFLIEDRTGGGVVKKIDAALSGETQQGDGNLSSGNPNYTEGR